MTNLLLHFSKSKIDEHVVARAGEVRSPRETVERAERLVAAVHVMPPQREQLAAP